MAAFVLSGLLVGSGAQARGWIWISQAAGRNPVAAIGDGRGSSVSIICVTGRNPVYVLDIRGPANGLKPGRGVEALVEGRRRVPFRLDRVVLEAGGRARLTSQAGYRGSIGDQSGTLEAIESIRTAKGPIRISSGSFRFTVSSFGAPSAMAPLTRKCGDPKMMIRRAEGREGKLN